MYLLQGAECSFMEGQSWERTSAVTAVLALWCLQLKEALAYGCYMVCTTFLPQAVNVVTLFYGGNLVLDERMSAGALVSFMLYVASLNGAFQASCPILAHSICSVLGPTPQHSTRRAVGAQP